MNLLQPGGLDDPHPPRRDRPWGAQRRRAGESRTKAPPGGLSDVFSATALSSRLSRIPLRNISYTQNPRKRRGRSRDSEAARKSPSRGRKSAMSAAVFRNSFSCPRVLIAPSRVRLGICERGTSQSVAFPLSKKSQPR